MRTTCFDYTPLWRSTIGFDRFLDMVGAAQRAGSDDNYPPYNIQRLGDDSYQISVAVAGFGPDDIAVTAEQSSANISIGVFPGATSSVISTWPIMFKSRTRRLKMACFASNELAKFQRP
jgi:HSP20 family molecular chaperone IbpA